MDSDADEDPSPLEQELEALTAIYIDELSFDRTENGRVKDVSLLLHPATGNDTTKQFVCMNLVFHPTEKYPDEVPGISIRNPRGLAQEEVSSLVEDMKAKAEESIGEVMLYTLIEMAKDCLTEGNIPHSPCIVCLEHFDESSSFRRTACYHYFHNRCLHKYLEHVRAQQAEEEAEDARRIMHHKVAKNKEIICPMCRCPLDEEILSVNCVDVDEEDNEATFVPSPALRAQQREMAVRFERQKARGGIIDLEWEKNKNLVNLDDRSTLRTASETPQQRKSEEEDVNEAKQLQRSPRSGQSNLRDSQHSVQFHGNKSDDRKFDRSDRHRDYGGGHGRVWRGFRNKHRNLHNDRRYYEGDDEPKSRSDRYRYEERGSYNNRDHYNDDHSFRKANEMDCRFQEGGEKYDPRNDHERQWSKDGVPYSDRSNSRGGRWRDKGRGGGRGREGPLPAYSKPELDDCEIRNSDHRTHHSENDSAHLKGDSDGLSLDQNNTRKSNSRSGFCNESRRDHRSNGSDGHGQRARGHERRYGRDLRGASHCGDERFNKGDRWSQEGDEDRGSEHGSSRSDRGKSHCGRGSYQNRRYHSQHSHRESHGPRGEGNQWRRERGLTGARFTDSLRNGARRRDAEVDDVNDRSADEETDADKDLRNFEINQKWRSINSMPADHFTKNQTMPKKFGVIDDDENEEWYDKARREADTSESDDDSPLKPNPNYSMVNEEVDHFYPGFNRGEEAESWEDEIDPYATEYNRFREEELKKFISHQKSRHSHLQNKLKQRVQQENVMDEEMRRIGKERDKRRKVGDHGRPEEGNTTQSTASSGSILEQFKQSQEKRNSGSEQEDNVEKSVRHEKRDNNKFFSAGGKTASDDPHSVERLHSDEELSTEEIHESSAQGGHGEKDDMNNSTVKEIKWCGQKPQENSYPPMAPISDHDAGVDLIHSDVYEDAWERKSALAKKSTERRKKKSKKSIPEQGENRAFRERNYVKNFAHGESRVKQRDDDRKSSYEKLVSVAAEKKEKGNSSENSLNGASLTTAITNNYVPKSHQEFRKPRPLDMRKNYNSFTVSRGLNDVLVAEDEFQTTSQNAKTDTSKTAFRKPKPVDFRKTVHKPLHEYAKDAPS